MPGPTRNRVPEIGLPVIRELGAVLVQDAEIVVRLGHARLRRPLVPFRGGTVVARDPAALRVQRTETDLRYGDVLFGSLRIPFRGLRFIPRQPVAALVQGAEIDLRGGVALHRGAFEPAGCERRITRQILARDISEAKLELRLGIAVLARLLHPVHAGRAVYRITVQQNIREPVLRARTRRPETVIRLGALRGAPIPAQGRGPIRRNADTLFVDQAEIELRGRVTADRGAFEPSDRPLIVRRHTEAATIQNAEIELRRRIAGFGERLPFRLRRRVIAAPKRLHAFFDIGPCGKRRKRNQNTGEQDSKHAASSNRVQYTRLVRGFSMSEVDRSVGLARTRPNKTVWCQGTSR